MQVPQMTRAGQVCRERTGFVGAALAAGTAQAPLACGAVRKCFNVWILKNETIIMHVS